MVGAIFSNFVLKNKFTNKACTNIKKQKILLEFVFYIIRQIPYFLQYLKKMFKHNNQIMWKLRQIPWFNLTNIILRTPK